MFLGWESIFCPPSPAIYAVRLFSLFGNRLHGGGKDGGAVLTSPPDGRNFSRSKGMLFRYRNVDKAICVSRARRVCQNANFDAHSKVRQNG